MHSTPTVIKLTTCRGSGLGGGLSRKCAATGPGASFSDASVQLQMRPFFTDSCIGRLLRLHPPVHACVCFFKEYAISPLAEIRSICRFAVCGDYGPKP
jgi:hypothetical protein